AVPHVRHPVLDEPGLCRAAVHRLAGPGDARLRPVQHPARHRDDGQNDPVRDMNLLQSFLPTGMLAEDALVLMAALCATVCTCAVWQALVTPDPVKANLKKLQERRTRLHGDLLEQRRKRKSTIGESAQVMSILKRLDLLRSREAEKAQLRLAQAGLRSREALITFQFAKLTLPFVVGLLGVVTIYWLQLWDLPEDFQLPCAMLMAVLGWAAPEVLVKNLADKRRKAILKGLPDAIDLMVICAEAGLSLDATLSRVAREMAPSAPELADE